MNSANREYKLNVVLNYVFRITALLLGLYSSRITIHYMGQSLYGHWATILSIASWMGSGDFGIGNGLRNKLTEAYAKDDIEQQRKLISTAFVTLSKVTIVLVAIFVVMCQVLLSLGILHPIEHIPMLITLVFFGLNLVLSIFQSIAYAYQKSWYCTFLGFWNIALNVLFIWGLNFAKCEADLVIMAIVHGLATTIPNIMMLLFLRKKFKDIFVGFRIGRVDKQAKDSVMNMGIQFFILQLCSVILYSTDNLIISYLFDSIDVTKYSVITKIYDTGNTLFSILLVALWSAVTYRIAQKDFAWVKKNIINLLLCWVVYIVGVLGVSLLFNPIVGIWLGEEAIYYEAGLVTLFAFYSSVTAFSAIFVNVVNGMGKIKLQVIVAIFCAVVNIPLSVYFASNCGMGIFGIKLGTFVCAVITAIIIPVQAIYELKKAEKKATADIIPN